MARRIALLLTFLVAATAGLDGGASAARRAAMPPAARAASALELAPVPAVLKRSCRSLSASREVAVSCPARLPQGAWLVAHATLRTGRCVYLFDAETRPSGSGAAFHVLAGGRCAPLPLATSRGRWPAQLPARSRRDDLLGLVGSSPLRAGQPGTAPAARVRLQLIGRVRVAGHAGVMLRVARYEVGGGVHGGHVAVVWNERGDGYVLSLHFAAGSAPGPDAERETVLAAAAAMSRGR